MPQVGNKKFDYTEEGEQQAAAYAAETGQEILQENSLGYARGGEVKPGMLDFAWKKYIEGSQEYRESQQDLYMQDKEYWDDYKAHRGYLDTVKNDAEARHSIKEMDSFGYGTTRG
tara:strand:- start:2220 stop:2564 length:345 start_codon:yes stop_codon:yes gene_type:complete